MKDERPEDAQSDWSTVNHSLQRRANNQSLPLGPIGGQAPGTGLQASAATAPAKPDGIIASFKANSITRKAALEHLGVFYEKQLEYARHHLSEVVRVRKAESTAVAEQLLASINSQQMHFLVQVGLRNEDVRNRAVVALNNQTSSTLRDVVNADWPDALREQAIEGIMDRNRKFFERLMKDLGEA